MHAKTTSQPNSYLISVHVLPPATDNCLTLISYTLRKNAVRPEDRICRLFFGFTDACPIAFDHSYLHNFNVSPHSWVEDAQGLSVKNVLCVITVLMPAGFGNAGRL